MTRRGSSKCCNVPTNLTWLVPPSFLALTAERRSRSLAALGQIGVYPFSENESGLKTFDPVAVSENAVCPPGRDPSAPHCRP
jgi:hypothetical protein